MTRWVRCDGPRFGCAGRGVRRLLLALRRASPRAPRGPARALGDGFEVVVVVAVAEHDRWFSMLAVWVATASISARSCETRRTVPS